MHNVFKPFGLPAPDAIGQCERCLATVSIDLADVLTGMVLIHKDPSNPRYKGIECGGKIRLFQAIKGRS